MGDTSAISNSNVVWTSLIAYVVLKEKLHWLDLVAIPLTIGEEKNKNEQFNWINCLVGILFFAQPSFIFGANDNTEFSTLGLVFSLASAVLAASCFNIIRKIGKDVHFTVTVMYYSIMGAVITGLIVYTTTGFHLPCRSELGYLIYIGPNGIIGQSCLTMALQREKAGRVAIARTSQIFFAFLIQVYVIGEATNLWSIVGAILVFCSSLIVGIRKLVSKK